MKILLTKTLPTESGEYLWCNFDTAKTQGKPSDMFFVDHDGDGLFVCAFGVNSYVEDIGGYWAKVEPSMFQLCESEQERREIIQKQHSNDTHRAVDIDRPEPECKCDSPDPAQTNASDHSNTHICLNCVGWSKEGEA